MMLTVTKNVIISQEDIDEIMCTALEGGITYWCMHAQSIMEEEWMKENNITYLSDVTGRGGDIVLTTDDGDYVLTLKAFLTGLQMAIDDDTIAIETINNEYHIDTCMIDADIADVIIQYALFGKLVYA
jgi:hypothetical protein